LAGGSGAVFFFCKDGRGSGRISHASARPVTLFLIFLRDIFSLALRLDVVLIKTSSSMLGLMLGYFLISVNGGHVGFRPWHRREEDAAVP
jgi:hypothetical protein